MTGTRVVASRDDASEAPAALVARAREVASLLASTALAEVDAGQAAGLHRELRATIDLLGAASARLLAKVEEDGRWAASGSARTFPEWVAQTARTSVGAARREAQLGKALDTLPGTASAVADGDVSLEHAQVLSQVASSSTARAAALASDLPDRNETFLLARARSLRVDDFRREARRWAMAVDAEAAEREHEQAVAKEYLTLARRHDGVAVQGFLTHEHGAALTAALRAVTGVPAAGDERTPQQRSAAALGDLGRLVLDKGLVGGGSQVRPHIVVTVDYPTFEHLLDRSAQGGGDGDDGSNGRVAPAGGPARSTRPFTPGVLEDGEPVPMSVLARLACDSEVTRVVFGPAGQMLDVGRAHRTYGGQLRRAVVARDRHCQFPSCSAPPSLGEVHHVRQWVRDGGATSVANGILLCWYHHDLVHRRNLRIRRTGDRWEITRSDGGPLAGAPPGQGPVSAGRDGGPPREGAEAMGGGRAPSSGARPRPRAGSDDARADAPPRPHGRTGDPRGRRGDARADARSGRPGGTSPSGVGAPSGSRTRTGGPAVLWDDVEADTGTLGGAALAEVRRAGARESDARRLSAGAGAGAGT